jgi:transcriptional regulator with XRE-family HTH domain
MDVDQEFGQRLAAARQGHGFTQSQLARATDFHQSLISDLETGKRLPTFSQAVKLASALKVSLQCFLTLSDYVGSDVPDISIQLAYLGLTDLQVENERVPGAFRPHEDVLALVVAGNAPAPRIVEAMPALLAWNDWDPNLLLAFAKKHDERARARLGWLADIALTIHQGQGFPGGCNVPRLEAYIRLVSPEAEDTFGFTRGAESLPPVSLRWKVRYPASLDTFRDRAERLQALRRQRLIRSLSVP